MGLKLFVGMPEREFSAVVMRDGETERNCFRVKEN
jgi:hypothetical protein